jgi:hypothetical protein
MAAHALFHDFSNSVNEAELFSKIQFELIQRYSVEPGLASEMAWDFIEVLSAIDGNIEIFEKYFLQ